MGWLTEQKVRAIIEILEALSEAKVCKAGINSLLVMLKKSTIVDGRVVCNMTYDDIAKEMGMSRQAVFISLQKLKEIGFIENKGHGKFEIYI